MDNGANIILYNNLKSDKIKINWNKNPIEMGKFMSFLTVQTIIVWNHLGSDTGWTRRENKDLNLIVCGGCVNGVEYLDSIQFGAKMQNRYNDFVNPFALFEIMTQEGRDFFFAYYRQDIEDILEKHKQGLVYLKNRVSDAEATILTIRREIDKMHK